MIRFGLIGTNKITDSFIEAARGLEDFALAAVYSRTSERAAEFASKYNIPHTFTDLEEMAKSDQVDAVYIASPTSHHAQHAITCMKHGKHVLVEKPIASNAREMREMIAAAKENKVLLMEAMKSTFVPNFAVIRENLPKLGTIRGYFAAYCQYSSRYDAYKEGNVMNAFKPEFSNGSLMDIGIYSVYPLVSLFGKPNKIKASAVMLESGVDGKGSLLLQYDGMDAAVLHSKISNSQLPAEIQGEAGNMIIENISYPNQVRIEYRDGKVEELTVPQAENVMVYEAEAFIRLIQSGQHESDINSPANSLAVLEVLDEARSQIGLVFPADRL
ncbi:oxidoreductase [Paenibacillus sp. BIHB 4019]|uniref:Oxidoreductase n=1 Tax=Paenibacillus sp. BIHB 4019 TaxID=1870819 RepID=A0A1B2DIC5_9BACL|nr:Gfo/Idh/MocA family oxidoreductase [Paenibacillus sp. BIHB 4019]ANY67451.1 oxidoreductase [Paenibacillus sp. BIHB 4019]